MVADGHSRTHQGARQFAQPRIQAYHLPSPLPNIGPSLAVSNVYPLRQALRRSGIEWAFGKDA